MYLKTGLALAGAHLIKGIRGKHKVSRRVHDGPVDSRVAGYRILLIIPTQREIHKRVNISQDDGLYSWFFNVHFSEIVADLKGYL